MIPGLEHQYTPQWRDRWSFITTALHQVSMALVLVGTVALPAGAKWTLGAYALAFLVRAAWAKAHDHVDARMARSMAELMQIDQEVRATCAGANPPCGVTTGGLEGQECCRVPGHSGPHVHWWRAVQPPELPPRQS